MKSHQFLILTFVLSLLSSLFVTTLSQAGACSPTGPFCQQGYCCSKHGYCGNTHTYCGPDCQSQCPDSPPISPPPPPTPTAPSPPPPPPSPPTPPGEDLRYLITKEMFEEMLKNRNDPTCDAAGFYTYEGFITAAKLFPEFGNTGDLVTRQREIASFFAQTSHETTGGWDGAYNGGRFAWGYCWISERDKSSFYCDEYNTKYPCVPGIQYYGRGPMQLSWNYNYGQFGDFIGLNLLSNPDLVLSNDIIAFQSAIWFWMTTQAPKPSCHDVMVEKWVPSQCDIRENRLGGLGVTTNIINGGMECNGRNTGQVHNRIGFYTRYCDLYGIRYGDHLDCDNQTPYSDSWCLASSNLLVAST